jgi:hypothetical protein
MARSAAVEAANVDQESMELIQLSGVLNPNATLDKIMEVSSKIAEIHAASGITERPTVFIHHAYIYSTS